VAKSKFVTPFPLGWVSAPAQEIKKLRFSYAALLR
jgi:hypothetical protein